MNNTSLLVHTINNNLENIEVLLEEDNLDKEKNILVGKIINEQLNKILENAELYYLEDEEYAINKNKVFFLEFVNFIIQELQELIDKKGKEIAIKTTYKNKKVEVDLNTLKSLLNYLLLNYIDYKNIDIKLYSDEIYLKIS